MSMITEPKVYTGKDLETIFFRPMLTGPDANSMGIRVLYNMPVPTTLNFWRRPNDVLQSYSAGWNGGKRPDRFQKSMRLHKMKAELGITASDYFSMVFEQITGRADVNMGDLSGTELEEAETKLFKEAIAESIRATMWVGKTSRSNGRYATFDGFIPRLLEDSQDDDADIAYSGITAAAYSSATVAEDTFKTVWNQSMDVLKSSKKDGQLAYFVTSDIYAKYEASLDSAALESAYLARQEGREALSYKGIPVIDIQVDEYIRALGDVPATFVLLTDRRNLALAVNTSDFPGTEVRMWYNPDEMENRQRAVFMAGCDYLLPELVSFSYKM